MTESKVLTRVHIRYGGDSENTISLLNLDGKCYLVYDDGKATIKSITTNDDYIEWLFYNYVDLLRMAEDDYPHNWWSEQHPDTSRKDEFKSILNGFKQ